VKGGSLEHWFRQSPHAIKNSSLTTGPKRGNIGALLELPTLTEIKLPAHGAKMPHNKALQLTANPLRGLSAAELGRYLGN
jgi:hypothetical protein